MIKRRIATVLTVAAGFVLLGASAAYAGDQRVEIDDYWYGYSLGHATWTENGDTLKVCDDYPDGYGVRGYIYVPYTGNEENGTVLMKASDPSNDGNCVTTTKNISETGPLYIKVCNYAGAAIGPCNWVQIR